MNEQTPWEIIYNHFKSSGFEVYEPNQHVGECKSKYVVVKAAGLSKFSGYSTATNLYDILCYVPRRQFSTLEVYLKEVRTCLRELENSLMLRPVYFETAPYYDEDAKAHMVSMQYAVYTQIT